MRQYHNSCCPTMLVWRRWCLWTAACVLAMVGGNGREFISGVCADTASSGSISGATSSQKHSIPRQILGAKMPALQQQQQQQQQQTLQQKQKQQLWLYEGALYDPLDGRRVASVQGLELVRPITDTSHLAIDALLKHPNATYEDSTTVWSQKIFCYTTEVEIESEREVEIESTEDVKSPPSEKNPQPQSQTRESILDSVRIRPRSPKKEVPLDQAVAVYEMATTFVSRRKKSRNSNGDDVEVLVHSEWPNGQTVWGAARDCSRQRSGTDDNSGSSSNIDFTIFAKLRNKGSPLYAPDLIREEEKDAIVGTRTKTRTNGDVIVSPKRAALVQFGSSSTSMESKHKFGARETYSYRNIPSARAQAQARGDSKQAKPGWLSGLLPNRRSPTVEAGPENSSPTLYYTRHGEGPPFYAPGRMCMLELRGRPISGLGEVGPSLRKLLLGNGDGNDSNNNNNEGSKPPPIANFHWKEAEREKEGDNENVNINNDQRKSRSRKRREARAPSSATGTTTDGDSSDTIINIQTAWNLRERHRPNGNVAGRQRRQRQRRQPQPLVLQLDENAAIGGETTNRDSNWKTLAKKGRIRAGAAWDRIKASTAMEARS